ncbi:MAG: hypothetical protein LBK99_11005, partial [Opitutaceae bacterium]|nr:hypothetical protein [Opitutaceae bacterium]
TVGCVALLLTHGYGRQLRFAREHIEPLRGSPASFASTPTRIVCTPKLRLAGVTQSEVKEDAP